MLSQEHQPKQLISLVLSFQTEILNIIRDLDQRCLEKSSNTLSLIQELTYAHTCFGIGIKKALVGLVHAWRDALHLPQLVAAVVVAGEDFEDQYTKVVCIQSMRWVLLDNFPPSFGNFWRHVSCCIRDETAIGGYDGIILLHRAQRIKATQLPLATFTEEDGGWTDAAVYGCSVGIYELERFCDVVQSPFGSFLSQTPSLYMPAEWAESLCGDVYVCVGLDGIENFDYPWVAQGS